MKKGDLVVGLVVLLIFAVLGIGYMFYLDSLGKERVVNIYIDGKLYESVKLTEETDEYVIVDNKYGYNKIHIYNMGVEVEEANCHNQIDVKQGFVKTPGISIICLPHHLRIVIEGENQLFDDITS